MSLNAFHMRLKPFTLTTEKSQSPRKITNFALRKPNTVFIQKSKITFHPIKFNCKPVILT